MIKEANPDPGEEIYAGQRGFHLCAYKEAPRCKPVRVVSSYYAACRC